mgnify:CR=1 FL=1
MNQKELLHIIYDGPALQDNEMDVRDLAPSLLAFADLLEETNRILYGDKTQVQINIKGSFKTGSFKVDLSVIQKSVKDMIDLFNTKNANAITNILQILGISLQDAKKIGLIQLIKWLKNRKIKKITKIGKGKTILEVDDEQREVEEKVLDLFRNLRIRNNIEVFVTKPLDKEGINTLKMKYQRNVETIKKGEKDYFRKPEVEDEPLEDQIIETNLQPVTVCFAEGNKWRFTDGGSTFFVLVLDNNFIEKVKSNKISFSAGDIFKVKLRRKQFVTDEGIKTEYEILKVISHRPAAKQIKLPFEGEENKNK